MVKNAAEALPEAGGRIDIQVGVGEDGGVTVSVADDGEGMSEETLEHVFEPFYTTKPAGNGTGLGLSMSQRIIAEHGGRLEVESELGRGTAFAIRLPAFDDETA